MNLIGKQALDFTAEAVDHIGAIITINFQQYAANKKIVLFFYPLNFTFVCPTELIAINNRYNEFQSRNTEVLAISVDSIHSHIAWKKLKNSEGGIGNISFPLISDIKRNISRQYNMLFNDEGISLRGSVIIDENFIVRNIIMNDLPLGRNIDEHIRILDTIEHHFKHGEVCPAQWNSGKKGMIATNKGVAEYLSNHAKNI